MAVSHLKSKRTIFLEGSGQKHKYP
jgi:hypothetical protein